MGLDMYLSKRTYVKNWDHMSPAERHQVTVLKNGTVLNHIKPERISYITEQVGYWRKFNALHGWFVENCQDGEDKCQESSVSKEKLELLLTELKKVHEEPALAGDILPTSEGFFFGGTDYDEYYHEQVNETIELIEGLLTEDSGDDFYYQASW